MYLFSFLVLISSLLNEVPLSGKNTKGLSGVKIPQVLINQVSFKRPSANAEVLKCPLRVQVPKHLKRQSAKFRGPKTVKLSSVSDCHKCLIAFF